MTFRSKWPDIDIPETGSLQDFLFSGLRQEDHAKTAFVDVSGRQFTHKEVFDYINKVAGGLHTKGLKKGEVLCIYSHNVIEYPIALHAVGKIGAIASTANPLYTADELLHQLEDSGAVYILTAAPYVDKVKEAVSHMNGKIREVFVFGEADGCTPFSALLESTAPVPHVDIDPRKDTFILPYSSGTTGKPKGVILTHYNLIANVAQASFAESDILPTDCTVGVLPFFHIYGIILIMNVSLYKRIKVVVVPRFDAPSFLQLVQQHRITHLHIVPPIVLFLAKHPLVEKFDLSSVRVIFSGAAPLGASLEEAVEKRLKCVCKQAYGMTEMSPGSNINPTNAVKKGSVGPILPNMEMKIISTSSGEHLGVNQDGELCYRGPNVMVGYLNRPDATAATIDSDGFIHTGDIGHIDEDGYVFIVDRVKELIKYKGYQVAPAEMEELLLKHESIVDAAVIGLPDDEAGELPKAFVQLKPGSKVTENEIEEWVSAQVAPHKKLRGGVEFIDAIPKSAAGKILRRELRDRQATVIRHKRIEMAVHINKPMPVVWSKICDLKWIHGSSKVTTMTGSGVGATREATTPDGEISFKQKLIAFAPERFTFTYATVRHSLAFAVGSYETTSLSKSLGNSTILTIAIVYPTAPPPDVVASVNAMLEASLEAVRKDLSA